jgi:hypothetical protein
MLTFALIRKVMSMNRKRLFVIISAVVLLLLIPLIVMQFTDGVNWSIFDFVVAGVLLMGIGILGDFLMRKIKNTRHRVFICLFLLALLIIVWAELAVGIFGSPFGGH